MFDRLVASELHADAGADSMLFEQLQGRVANPRARFSEDEGLLGDAGDDA